MLIMNVILMKAIPNMPHKKKPRNILGTFKACYRMEVLIHIQTYNIQL